MNKIGFVILLALSLANIDNENSAAAPEGTLTDYGKRMQRNRETNCIECHCGKLCNRNRRFRAHQRFCHVNYILELRDWFEIEQLIDNDTDNSDDESIINHVKIIPKKGIKLPITREEWNTANEYFKQHLNSCKNVNGVEIRKIQKAIYDYFAENNGTVGGKSDNLKQQYEQLSKR